MMCLLSRKHECMAGKFLPMMFSNVWLPFVDESHLALYVIINNNSQCSHHHHHWSITSIGAAIIIIVAIIIIDRSPPDLQMDRRKVDMENKIFWQHKSSADHKQLRLIINKHPSNHTTQSPTQSAGTLQVYKWSNTWVHEIDNL